MRDHTTPLAILAAALLIALAIILHDSQDRYAFYAGSGLLRMNTSTGEILMCRRTGDSLTVRFVCSDRRSELAGGE